MKISLILCTYNRCMSLATTLDSVAASTLPDSVEWEVLVVDNNSHDRTRLVVEQFCRRHPGRFRYLFEPVQGKSRALNTGILEARGDIVAFTDDDVTVDPNWLRNLTAGLEDGKWAGSGGRTLAESSFSPPMWVPFGDRHGIAPLGITALGSEAGELMEAPYGNNMAFRRAMFEKYGGFRTDLGPRPGSRDPQKCEDSEFGCRLLAAGERLRYEPSAIVYHSVPESRLQKKYFLAWWFDKARADIRAFGTLRNTTGHIAGIPLVLFRRLGVWTVRWMIAVEPSQRFSAKLKVWIVVGQVVESYRQGRCGG